MINNYFQALKDDLLAATAGSAELDLRIGKAIGKIPHDAEIYVSKSGNATWQQKRDHYTPYRRLTPYTRSLDATENTLAGGWRWAKMETHLDAPLKYRWTACLVSKSSLTITFKHDNTMIARALVVIESYLVGRSTG